MQSRRIVIWLLLVAFTEALFFSSSKCSIKKYKAGKYIIGDQLLVHENFQDRVKPLENVAKDCKVRLYIKGSYYQLPNPAQPVAVTDADLVIGHGFQFELRDENNALLCNKLCLGRNPMDVPQVRCFLQGAMNNGLTWSRYNTDVLSDGTYAANTGGYQALKTDIQIQCQNDKFKRQLMRTLRKLYEEEDEEEEKEKK